MRTRTVSLVAATALIAFAFVMPGVRLAFLQDVLTFDEPPSEPVMLPPGEGPDLSPVPSVRVILIDGLSETTAAMLPAWQSLCRRGVALRVDVGFPTVSLPVEVALWSGLTQQQTGIVFRSDRPLVAPLEHSLARQVDSQAIAENHGYIVRSLGFARTQPEALDAEHPAVDAGGEAWRETGWLAAAREAVASDTRLVFVHVLRVDTWGHRKGRDSFEYGKAAGEADAILAELVALAPNARWFLLSDHGHIATGGHGGEEREVRQVQHCIVDLGTAVGADPLMVPGSRGGPVHLVDVSRALARSLGGSLPAHALGRPLSVAKRTPLDGDTAVPPLALPVGAVAIFVLALGFAASWFGVRRWWLAPWWFVLACALLVIVRGDPTMSKPMVYAKESILTVFDVDRRLMLRSWLAALPLAALATWYGLGTTALWRVLVAQLALPLAALAAAITACSGWGALLGADIAPVAPHYTAYTSALMLITAHGSAAVGLTVLARTARSAFGRRSREEIPRSAPSVD